MRLCERELLDRERRAAERRLRAAKFPVIKTLDMFDFRSQSSLNEPLVRELLRGEYIDQRENVLLMGNSGTGKTHLSSALGFSACALGKKVRFFTVTQLVNELLEKREDRQLKRFLVQLEKQHLLILDELGYVPFSKARAKLVVFRAPTSSFIFTVPISTVKALPDQSFYCLRFGHRQAGRRLELDRHPAIVRPAI